MRGKRVTEGFRAEGSPAFVWREEQSSVDIQHVSELQATLLEVEEKTHDKIFA